jgi:GNAT superfamily N-acetyltransferase
MNPPESRIQIDIAPAEADDDPALCALFNAARADCGHFPGPPFTAEAFDRVVAGEEILVARINGQIAGFAAVWLPDRFVHHLFVAPEHQHQGVGRALVAAWIERAGLPLELKCLEANLPARRFYETGGWQPRETAQGPDGPYVRYVLPAPPETPDTP